MLTPLTLPKSPLPNPATSPHMPPFPPPRGTLSFSFYFCLAIDTNISRTFMLGGRARWFSHKSQDFLSSDSELGTMANSLIVISHFQNNLQDGDLLSFFTDSKRFHYLVFSHVRLSDPKFKCFQPPLAAFPLA